jgi:transaldolase
MDYTWNEKIKKFIIEGVDENPVAARSDSFWQKLKNVGTELWLDTGDMEEAEKIWTTEMTALTTNNTLVNKEIQKGIYDDFIAEAIEIVKDLPPKEQVVDTLLNLAGLASFASDQAQLDERIGRIIRK